MTNYDPVKKRKYYLKNQKRIDAYQKEYREKNREMLRLQDQIYYENIKKPKGVTPERRAWEKEHREEIREYQKQYRANNKKELQEKKQFRLYKIRIEVLEHMGSKCKCCGEANEKFLTIDHINGRDKDEPRITGKKLWRKVRTEGYPKNKYQLLCFNCNCAKGIYGICPHQMEKGMGIE